MILSSCDEQNYMNSGNVKAITDHRMTQNNTKKLPRIKIKTKRNI